MNWLKRIAKSDTSKRPSGGADGADGLTPMMGDAEGIGTTLYAPTEEELRKEKKRRVRQKIKPNIGERPGEQ